MFDILQDHCIAQPTPDGKAIWKATITSHSGWSHSFTLLKVSPASIWQQDVRPEPYAGTVAPISESELEANATDIRPIAEDPLSSRPEGSASEPLASSADDDEQTLQVPAGASDPEDNPTPPMVTDNTAGEALIAWLRDSIRSGKLLINDAKALVHTVDGTVFLISPGVFQRYFQEHPHVAKQAKTEDLTDWQWIQKQFEKLGLHRKQDNGLNIWMCEVKGPRKSRKVHGYLLKEMNALLNEALPNNPYLQLERNTAPV